MKITYIFLHNFRCTGNALNLAIGHYFRQDHIKLGRWGNRDVSYPELLELCKQQPSFVLGHNVFGLHQKLGYACRYFVNFREPIARLVSGFAGWSGVAGQDIRSYYAEHEERSNGMTYRLLGYGMLNGKPYDFKRQEAINAYPHIDEALFAQVQENFNEWVDGIFVSERFEESLLNFENKLSLPNLVYPQGLTFNQNKTSFKPEHFPQSVLDDLRALNEWDEQLYNLANERLDRELSDRDETFFEQVRLRKILTDMLKVPGQDLVEGQLMLKKLQAGLNNLHYLGMHEELAQVLALFLASPTISKTGAGEIVDQVKSFLSVSQYETLKRIVTEKIE